MAQVGPFMIFLSFWLINLKFCKLSCWYMQTGEVVHSDESYTYTGRWYHAMRNVDIINYFLIDYIL